MQLKDTLDLSLTHNSQLYAHPHCYTLRKQSQTLLQNEAGALRSSRPISSQMQVFPGQSTCVKPTLTRPQSSKAECLILRHRRHAAIRVSCCAGELTVLSSTPAQPPNSQPRRFLGPIVRQSARSHANTPPSSVARDEDMDAWMRALAQRWISLLGAFHAYYSHTVGL